MSDMSDASSRSDRVRVEIAFDLYFKERLAECPPFRADDKTLDAALSALVHQLGFGNAGATSLGDIAVSAELVALDSHTEDEYVKTLRENARALVRLLARPERQKAEWRDQVTAACTNLFLFSSEVQG